MKKITTKMIMLLALLANVALFAQATGEESNSNNYPIGIQNNFGVEDSRSASVPSVLIAGAPGTADWIDDVEAKLDATGLVAADTFLTNGATPTLAELQSYDAVFVFTDANALDPVAFGDNLGQYIDGGGAVVDATFTPLVEITGGFTQYELYSNGNNNSTIANLGLGNINDPSHPTLNGVTTFDGGTASFHNTAGTVAAGATIIAEYTDASPFIIVQENVGAANARRVFLNFYPPSIDARDDFWDTASDGALVMANALLWATNTSNNSGPTILIAASPGINSWIDDVEAKIEETNFFNADTFLTNDATPTLAELQQYDAVFVFTDAGVADSAGFGDVLEQYIDAGGPVVDATFTPNVNIAGGFVQYELYSNSGQSSGNNLGIGAILEPGDPILTNVTNFDGGTSSFHNTAGTVAAGATIIAEYTDGSPLLIRDENVGPANTRRVFVNFYPPSIDARDDFWDTASDGALIIRNALEWAISGQVLSTDDNSLNDLGISIYPNPVENELTIANPSGISIQRTSIIDITGRVVQTLDANDAVTRTVDVSGLSTGMYLVQMENGTNSQVIKFIKR